MWVVYAVAGRYAQDSHGLYRDSLRDWNDGPGEVSPSLPPTPAPPHRRTGTSSPGETGGVRLQRQVLRWNATWHARSLKPLTVGFTSSGRWHRTCVGTALQMRFEVGQNLLRFPLGAALGAQTFGQPSEHAARQGDGDADRQPPLLRSLRSTSSTRQYRAPTPMVPSIATAGREAVR